MNLNKHIVLNLIEDNIRLTKSQTNEKACKLAMICPYHSNCHRI